MVDIYVRKRGRAPSGALFVTFALGLAIGFSIAYAFLSTGGAPEPAPPEQKPAAAAPAEPPSPTETAGAQPAEGAVPEPAAPEAAPQETAAASADLWPGRFLFVAVEGAVLDDAAKALIKEIRPGGVVLRETNLKDAKQTGELIAQIKAEAGQGDTLSSLPLIAVDQEGGKQNPLRVKNAPGAAELGKTKNAKAAREAGRAAGAAAIERGIGVLLAPVLDVADSDLKDAELSARLFGTNHGSVTALGLAFAEGVIEAGAIPVAKYYPALGASRESESGEAWVVDVPSRRLAELMYPFSEAAARGIPGIVVGSVQAPSVDLQNPKRPAFTSPVLVQRMLRETWHYAGVVVADDVASKAATSGQTAEAVAVDALAAGCDAVMFLDPQPDRIRAACQAIQDAVDRGQLSAERLTESTKRFGAWQMRLASKEKAGDTTALQKVLENVSGEVSGPTEPTPPEAAPAPEPKPEEQPAEPEAAAPVEAAIPEQASKPEETPVVVQEPLPEPAPSTPPAAEQTAPPEEAAPVVPQPVVEQEAQAVPAAPETVPVEAAPETPPIPEQAAQTAAPPSIEAMPVEPSVPPQEPAAGQETQPAEPSATAAQPVEVPQPPDTEKITHAVERGESLGKIAQQFGVKTKDLASWNKLPVTTKVKIGDTLVVYRPLRAQDAAETAAPTEKTEAAPPAPVPDRGRIEHTVAPGETLAKIAARYKVKESDLMEWNKLMSRGIAEGQTLVVETPEDAPAEQTAAKTTTHTVAKGESIYKIAAKYRTTVKRLLQMNKLDSPDKLLVGQQLIVPQPRKRP